MSFSVPLKLLAKIRGDGDMKKWSLAASFTVAAAFIGFNIGASNSTGQESLQFIAGFGTPGLAGAVIMVALFFIFTMITVTDVQKYRLKSVSDMFQHYMGTVLGKILTVYIIVYMIGGLSLLISGSGVVFNDYLGIPNLWGRVIMTAATILLVIFGLKQVTRIGGIISVAIVLAQSIIPLINIITCEDGLSAGSALMQSMDIIRGASNWWMGGIMYFSWAALLAITYVGTLATNDAGCTQKELRVGLFIGCVILTFLILLPNAAIISNASVIEGSQTPNITLAERVHPALGIVVSLVVLIAIFTSLAPQAYSACSMIVSEKNKYFKPLAIVVCLIGFIGSCLGSFATIVNVITSVSAWVGFVYIAGVLITKFIRRPKLPSSEAL